jgi:hypothetical protein
MSINWQEVVTTVGSTAVGGMVLVSAAAWLIRTALTEKLARDAEAFRARLKADADTEIEQLKSSLEKTAFEHQVRYSKLHEKRAEVIAELHKRLVDAFWNGQRFVLTSENNPGLGQAEEYAKARQHIQEFVNFFEIHQIYLPTRACALVEKFVSLSEGRWLAPEVTAASSTQRNALAGKFKTPSLERMKPLTPTSPKQGLP